MKISNVVSFYTHWTDQKLRLTVASAVEDMGQQKPKYFAGKSKNWYKYLGKQFSIIF